MNAEPHTHPVEVKDGYSYVHITYGDTTVYVDKGRFLFERRLRRGIRKAIHRHDKGSAAAGRRARTVAEVVEKEHQRTAGMSTSSTATPPSWWAG